MKAISYLHTAALGLLFFAGIAKDNTISVMSYNVRRKGNDPEEFQWDKRKQSLFELALSKEPDAIGFQEVVKGDQFEDLKQGLPTYQSFGVSRSSKTDSWLQKAVMRHPKAKDECNPIFYNPKKLKLLKYDAFGINPRAIFFQDWLPRICQWGLFQDRETNKKFYLYNTHISNTSENIRNKQLDMIIKHIAEHTNNDPVILMGDFNTHITNDLEKKFAKARMHHASKAPIVIGPKETRTGWNDNELKEIDHIVIKNGSAALYEVVASEKGIYPSDHRPIFTAIVLS